MIAVVDEIKTMSSKKTGKNFWPVLLSDAENESAVIGCSFFSAPKFKQGDTIELAGSGMRRTEYQGKAQISVGKSTTVHVINAALAKAALQPTKRQDAPAAQLQQQRAASPAPAGPSRYDQPGSPVNGQTVGMAMKEALPLVVMAHGGVGDGACLKSVEFWRDVHTVASDIIRTSRSLEAGILAAPAKVRAGGAAEADPNHNPELEPVPERQAPPPRQTATKPRAGPDGSVDTSGADQDVPY